MMSSNGISQIESINSIDRSAIEDELIPKCRPSVEISERSKVEFEDLSSRIEIWDEQNSSRMSKKSFMLLAKNYPTYHHYSYKVGLLNRYHRLPESYAVLPEIKGHTISNLDPENENSKQIHNNISMKINTLQDLTNSILRYGSKSDDVWMKFGSSRNGQKLVRPGFSARRYMANLVRHLNDNLVEKLIADGKVLEKTIFQNSIILPHIRRRLSADLSRYPEPYRILKQMLISPGPLNEYSFVWKRSDYLSEEISSSKISEMNIGDIKILSKKSLGDNTDVFEEVQYAQMSHEKKKTVLSNLLLKSAMNHALKMKEEIAEHNPTTATKENVHNIHIPVINFDMMEAVTDLLNKETFEMLSNNIVPSMGNTGFKGQALRPNLAKLTPHLDMNEKIITESTADGQNISVGQFNNEKNSADVIPVNFIPNLTLRLNPTNVKKSNYKKKVLKTENHSGKQSSLSNNQNSVISFDPSNFGLPDYQSQMEAQSNAFVERLKNKTGKSGTSSQRILPYGIYRDSEELPNDRDLVAVGDIDPATSFNNWRYEDTKHTNSEFGKGFDSSSLSSSGNFPNNSLLNSKSMRKVSKGKLDLNSKYDQKSIEDSSVQDNQNRLFQLLNEHAETVAEKVLRNSGGEDFASDVKEAVIQWNEILRERYFELFSYVAIMEILQQKKSLLNQSDESHGQIWNLDVQDMHNEEEYSGMIKNIFKSLFKEQLDGVINDDVNISPEIMSLLQDGSKLALDNIEVKIDSITGKTIVTLKEEVLIKRETLSRMQKDNNNYLSRNMNYSQLNNIESSETPSFHPPSNADQAPSTSSIVITPIWDGEYLSNDNKRNPSIITEENPKSELGRSNDIMGTSNKDSSKLNSVQIKPGSVQDAHKKNSSSLSYNQTPSSKFNENLISENAERSSGEKSTAISTSEVAVKRAGSLIENDKNNYLSATPKYDLQKSNSKQSKQEFVVGRVDDTKDVMSLYSQSPEKLSKDKVVKQSSQKKLGKSTKQKPVTTKKPKQDNQKSKKKVLNTTVNNNETAPLAIKSEIINKIETVEPKVEAETLIEKEDNESIHLDKESSNHTIESESKFTQDFMSDNNEDLDNKDLDQIDDDISGDDEESQQRKLLIRQQREAKRKADAEKRRLEVDRKRREKEEQRKSELKRKELEESLTKKLEEERRQKEEEYRLKREREKAEELLRIEALSQEEYLRQKQIERERKEKEEFNKRLEEMKIKQAMEEQKRKLEQERLAFEESERIRIENEMISRMRENERIQYLKNKAEEEERRRLKEEEEKLMKEEQIRLALEEAQRIAQKQARERAELEARLNFIKGLKIENAGLKKFLNITPTFVWSYFEFLKILGLQPNPTTNKLESANNLTR